MERSRSTERNLDHRQLRGGTPARECRYKAIAAIRRRTEAFAADELPPLVGDPSRLRMYTMAVLSLGIDTARWYSPGRSPAPEELGQAYADLVLQMLGR